jgi:thioredoxin 1
MTLPPEKNSGSGAGERRLWPSARRLAGLLLVVISCVNQPQRKSSVMLLPQGVTEDFSVISGAAGTAMVDFFSSTCGQCGSMDSAVAHVAKRFEGRALVAKADVSVEYDLARRYSIASLPTFVFFKAGQETRRVAGPAPEDTLCSILDGLLNGPR